jgi:RNA polymerase sigma-70 factor (ECF subfamily)
MRRSLEDAAAFDSVFTRHVGAIYAFACARVGASHAEDVTSETFAAAFRSRTSFDPTATSARPWLFGIAANTLRRHAEHETRWLHKPRMEPVSRTGDEEDLADARLDAQRLAPRLARALAQLTPGERDVLLLHVLADMTHEQIAQVLCIRRGTAKSRLSRGRERLRATLEPFHDDPRGG